MFFLVKIIVALLAFFIRLSKKYFRFSKGEVIGLTPDLQATMYVESNKNRVTGTNFEIPLKCHAIFKLTEESGIDRYFKSLGLAKELQTNDPAFDSKIYIASDSYLFKEEIKNDFKVRELILELFKNNCQSISCDGANLVIHFKDDQRENFVLRPHMAAFFQQISDIRQSALRFLKDPYALRILLIESVIWSLSIYAYSSFFEWQFFKEDIHLEQFPLFRQGLLIGFALFVLLFAAIVLFLRESSRGHRILVESFFVLLLSIPAGGVALVGDINTQFDNSETILVSAKVLNLYERKHRRRKGGTYYTYHLQMQPYNEPSDFYFPKSLSISNENYRSLKIGGDVNFEIGRGRLRHAWIRNMRPGSAW